MNEDPLDLSSLGAARRDDEWEALARRIEDAGTGELARRLRARAGPLEILVGRQGWLLAASIVLAAGAILLLALDHESRDSRAATLSFITGVPYQSAAVLLMGGEIGP